MASTSCLLPNVIQNGTVGYPSVIRELTTPPDFDSQDDPLFLQVNYQDPANSTKDFYSQDDPLFLQVDIPQYHNGTSTIMYAPADKCPNVMTSSVTTGINHSYIHQTGKGSTVQKDSIDPIGSSVLKPPYHTPSHPMSKVSSPSVINREQPSNVYPSRFVYYPQGELKNLDPSSEINAYPIDLSKSSFKNVSKGLNEVGGFTSVLANRGQAVPFRTLSENTNNACLVSDKDVEYLCEISHNPVEKKTKYTTKGAKNRERYEKYLKHLNLDGETDVSPNSAEVSTFQSSKCVDKRRQDRYSIYEKTSKYLSKVDVNENLPSNVNRSTGFSNEDNLNSIENSNGRSNERIPVYMNIKDEEGEERCGESPQTFKPKSKTGVSTNSTEVRTCQFSKCVEKRRQDRYSIYEKTSKYLSKVNANENLSGTDFNSTYFSKKRNLNFLKNINDNHGEVLNYHHQTLNVKVCNLPSKTVDMPYVEKQNDLVDMNNMDSEIEKVTHAFPMLTREPTFHASDNTVRNSCDEQINSSGWLKRRNNLSTQCRYNDHQFQTFYGPERNFPDRIHFSKEYTEKENVAVRSNQQKIHSSGEKAEFCLPVQLNNKFLASKDADTSSVHIKYAPAISKDGGKEKKNDKKSNQPAKRSNKSGKGKSEALEIYKNAVLVYFDLETGGLYKGVDILQIAAVSNGRAFMQYVTPTQYIFAAAQNINGLKNENGTLMKRTSRIPLTWEPLETLPIEESLKKFLDWLDATGPCFLVAHNASFDKRHLLYQVNMAGLYSEFQKRVFGFIDTLPFFRAMYPELKKPGPGHRQEVLVKHVLQETYDAHDALEDVKSLQKLVKKVDASLTDLLKHKIHF